MKETLINLFCCSEKEFIHMNTWIAGKDLMKHHYLIKNVFHSCLNMEDITDIDYKHAKRVFRELKINSLGNYHDS